MRTLGIAVPIAFVLALLALLPFPAEPSFALAPFGARTLQLDVRGYRGSITIVPVSGREPLRDIAYYWDERYPHGRGASARFFHGLVTHLNSALRERAFPGTARDVDAAGLKTLLARPPAGTCLLVMDGILPDTVRTASHDALRRWILAGGTVIWAGEPFDAFFARPTARGGGPSPADFSKWPELYRPGGPLAANADWSSPDLNFGLEESAGWGVARIPYVRTTFGVDPSRMPNGTGVSIGYLDTFGNSSLSVLALGAGHLVLFGDGIEDESAAADFVAQILFTQAWRGGAPRFFERSVAGGSVALELPPGAGGAAVFAWTAHDAPFARFAPNAAPGEAR